MPTLCHAGSWGGVTVTPGWGGGLVPGRATCRALLLLYQM